MKVYLTKFILFQKSESKTSIFQKIVLLKSERMNRVVLSVLSQKNNLRRQDIETLSQLCQSRPLQHAWKSERFGIFPLEIVFYLSNPPFNKISLSLPSQYRTKIEIFGSSNGKEYLKLDEINEEKDDFDDYAQGGIVSKYFKKSQNCSYLKLKFHSPYANGLKNLCKQVSIRAIQVSNIIYFNCKYLCNLRKRLQFNPSIFRILQLLEYKTLVVEKEKPTRYTTQIKQKYCKRMNEIEDLVYKRKLNPVHPEGEAVNNLAREFEQLIEEPILEEEELDFSNPIQLKGRIKKLQSQLSSFYTDRLMTLQPNVTEYFHKYHNEQIRDIYLRLLSSPQDQDKTKALVEYWTEVKSLETLSPNIQQATLIFLNYFLEFINNQKIKTGAIKLLALFLKLETVGMKLYHFYERVFYNLIRSLEKDQKEEEFKLAYKAIFLMYSKLPHHTFMKELLKRDTHTHTGMKLKKLQIIEKIILNDEKFTIEKNQTKQDLVEFLMELLSLKQLTVTQKNSIYQIAAFLAQHFGKQQIIHSFEKLNTMLLMNMQKVIDKRLSTLPKASNEEHRSMCDYCGIHNPQFKEDNLYDIHCFKQCKMLTVCEDCSCIVEIPQLNRHYLEECQLKNKFKNCQMCFDVVLFEKEQEHNKKCLKKMTTKCPLCQQKLQSKLKIKQHILKDGCPNNMRN